MAKKTGRPEGRPPKSGVRGLTNVEWAALHRARRYQCLTVTDRIGREAIKVWLAECAERGIEPRIARYWRTELTPDEALRQAD
ncbi:MAG: hypothetical protein JO166_19685 [Deltaproteobacteria bacterium]|nr:hypothetical protein [Deltaproteobacteria bacterium]